MVEDAKARRDSVGGFARGTLVSTRAGLVPIEAVAVGDEVLSSADDEPARTAHRRVLGISRHDGQRIRQLIVDGGEVGKIEMIAASDATPMWVSGAGWTRAAELTLRMALLRADGTESDVVQQYPVYRTHVPGVGWTQSMPGNVALSHGNRYDYANAKGLPVGGFDDVLPKDILDSAQPFLEVTVFSIEVEETRAFFVGKQTVRVRDYLSAPMEQSAAAARSHARIDALARAASTLLAHCARLLPARDAAQTDDIRSMTPGVLRELFRALRSKDAPHNRGRAAEFATLLAESETCLQFAVGYLGAVRDLPALPAAATFEVPDEHGGAVPVAMPPESADELVKHAGQLAKSLAKSERFP